MSMPATFRRTLRLLVVGALYYSGVLPLWFWLRRKLARGRVLVLGFHRVLPEREYQQSCSLEGILLTETTFARMLAYLKPRFAFLTLDEFLARRGGNGKTSRAACLLTFDDGWRDNYRTAYPWLKKFGVPATIFLVTGLIGQDDTFWVERLVRAWSAPDQIRQLRLFLTSAVKDRELAEIEDVVEYLKHMPSEERAQILGRLSPAQEPAGEGIDRMMTWDQVVEMSHTDIDFGAHTHTHPLLPYEDDETVERELRLAKELLEEKLAKKVRAFAYPNGTWDQRVRGWVERTGYACAFTTQRAWYRPGQDPYAIPRILLHEGNVTGLKGNFSPAMLSFTLARGR
jgi:peptidoglycan/xylan/chitin deacetylase (PgdA/CDA1 family)